MKNLLLTIALVISSFSIFGQVAKVETDKEKYKIDEIIEVTFEINARYDSIDLPEFVDFEIIGGPNKNSSISILNGEKKVIESRTYRLRPNQSGRLTINSPAYYIDGKRIEGNPAKIKVAQSSLTEEELKEKKIQDFIENGIKPEGTIRIIIHENKGYIETFGEMGWVFQRQLTGKEIELIEKIK